MIGAKGVLRNKACLFEHVKQAMHSWARILRLLDEVDQTYNAAGLEAKFTQTQQNLQHFGCGTLSIALITQRVIRRLVDVLHRRLLHATFRKWNI